MSDLSPTTATTATPETQEDIAAAELNEFEQSFFDAIQTRFPSSLSEGTEDRPGPETEPAPASDPTVSAGEEVPVEGHEAPSPEPAPEEGEAPGGEPGQSPSVFTLSGGQQVTEDQIAQALQVHQYFSRLTPQQVQGIDALMSGQYRLAPATTTEHLPGAQPVASSGQTPSSPASSDEGEWLDPRAQQAIQQLQNEVQTLRQQTTETLRPVIDHQQDAEYNSRLSVINSVADQFQQYYELDDQTMRGLEQAIVESQVLPQLQSRYGSLHNGMAAALEMYYWSTPSLRERQMGKQSAAKEAEVQAQDLQDQSTLRKQQLTALSASGGSAPRREPVPSTPEDRHEAMKAEINAAMNGSGTIDMRGQ